MSGIPIREESTRYAFGLKATTAAAACTPLYDWKTIEKLEFHSFRKKAISYAEEMGVEVLENANIWIGKATRAPKMRLVTSSKELHEALKDSMKTSQSLDEMIRKELPGKPSQIRQVAIGFSGGTRVGSAMEGSSSSSTSITISTTAGSGKPNSIGKSVSESARLRMQTFQVGVLFK